MNSSFFVLCNPWILICLGREYRTVRDAGEDLQGYGIMRQVAEQTNGRMRLGPGTLYSSQVKWCHIAHA
jgi:hypothetical protein